MKTVCLLLCSGLLAGSAPAARNVGTAHNLTVRSANPIKAANDTAYGLAAAVHTRDIKKAHRAAKLLKAGTVWINTYNLYDPASPFGGYKQSGFGRELGKEALDGYLQTKSVWVDLS